MSTEQRAPSAVACDADARERIRAHVEGDLEREVGGFLAGRLTDGAAEVDLAIPALRAEGHRTNVTFTHEVWEDVLAMLDDEHPELRIVGWYHSHPGFGVFLSEYDTFIHRNFFPAEGMVALVVDPHTGADGWFGTRDGEVVRLDGHDPVSTPRQRPVASPVAAGAAPAAPRPRGAVLLVGSVAIVVGLVVGWMVGDAGTDAAGPVGSDATAARVEQLEAREAELRAQLDRVERRADRAEAAARSDGGPAADAGDVGGGAPELVDGFAYRVRPGDTLGGIAMLLAPDESDYLRRLIAANPQLDDPDVLAVGGQLWVPLPASAD